jgi:hypothetical protein
MSRAAICLIVICVTLVISFAAAQPAQAQIPVAVTAYYPAAPVVTYLPERRGLFGQRLVYRPVVSYAAPAVAVPAVAAPVTTYYAPAAPVTTYYAPAPPVTTYYAPPPVTTYYAPSPPVTVYRPVVVWP